MPTPEQPPTDQEPPHELPDNHQTAARDFLEFSKRVSDLHLAGRFHEALEVARAAAILAQRVPARLDWAARTSYWIACLQSCLGDVDQALDTLQEALQHGLWWPQKALLENPDLGLLREQAHGRAEFAALVTEAGRLQSAAQAMTKLQVLVFSPDRVDETSPLLLALHMRLANAEDAAVQWMAAVSAGLVLAVPQSSQVAGVNAFCWDDMPRAAQDLATVYTQLREAHTFDPDRVIVAGASQGGGLAVTLALNGGVLPSHRFIAVVPLMQDAQDTTALRQADIATLAPAIDRGVRRGARGWLLTGGQDFGRSHVEPLYREMVRRGLPCHWVMGPVTAPGFPQSFTIFRTCAPAPGISAGCCTRAGAC
jgi:alpha/beta hydrolase fold